MRKTLAITSLIFAAQTSHATMKVIPERCAHDNLNQWTEGGPIEGTARGRNQWMKVCNPIGYDMLYPWGTEFDPEAPNRRVYPTYGIITGVNEKNEPIWINDGYVAPTAPPANAGDPSCVVRAPNKFVGICTSGCVTPDSLITTPEGELPIGEMAASHADVVSVPTQAESGALNLSPMKVQRYYKDLISSNQKVLAVRTVSGGLVHVSKNHPLLSGTYQMVKTEDLKVGDSLVTADGRKDLITSISEEVYFGRLHNLRVETSKDEQGLYVVQGYISGDKRFQDAEVSEFNRRILRQIAFEAAQL